MIQHNDKEYDEETYHRTNKATGKQQWVADQWAEGALPVDSQSDSVLLYTSTRNFEGHQKPDGSGKLMHYRHIEAIRTISGVIIGDSSCYAKGFAKCNKPKDTDHYIDVTSLQTHLRGEDETIYEITEIEGSDVTFSSGRVWSLADDEWVGQGRKMEASPLGV
jgi:hypothetical protein